MTKLPDRLNWAVRVLDVRPDDQILEIGGGPGVAAELVCRQLGDAGRFVGIDRSAVAVRRSRERNMGKAVFHQLALEEYDGGEGEFDKVFAFNVNVFWTDPGGPGLGVITRVLRPDGTLHLFWDHPPGSARADMIVKKVTTVLTGHGFTVAVVTAPFAFGVVHTAKRSSTSLR